MKPSLFLSFVCILLSLHVLSQEYHDTTKSIELPAAIIKTVKSPSHLIASPTNFIRLNNANSATKRQTSAQDLPYLLDQSASVIVSSDGGTGTGYTGIRIRGSDLTRINVTMNGIPVNDAESQTTYFVDMPDIISSTKEIQIDKGVGSSKNGTGSFGASIAINNLDVDNISPSFSIQSDYGSFKTFKTVTKASTGLIHQRFITTIRLSSIHSDGYIQRSDADLKALQVTSKYLINTKTQVVFNYMQGKEKTGQAWNGVPEDSLLSNRTYNGLGLKSDGRYYQNQSDNYSQQYYQLFIDKKLSTTINIGSTLFYTKGKGYYEEYKMNELFQWYLLPDFIHSGDTITATDLVRQLWLDNHFYGIRFYSNYVSKKLDAGLYLNMNQYNGKHHGDLVWAQYPIPNAYRWYNLQANKYDINLYGMLDYRFSKSISILGDLQVRDVHYKMQGFRSNPGITHNLNYLFFNPKGKLTFQTSKEKISLLVGLAQKEPNRDDFETGSTQLPKPEKLLNIEANYARSINPNLVLYTTVFAMLYQDQLVLTGKINDVGAYTRTNVDKSYRLGIELEGLWKPAKTLELTANLSLSENKIQEMNEYLDNYDQGGQVVNHLKNTTIAFSPSISAASRISLFPCRNMRRLMIKDLSFDLTLKYVGQQYLDNTQNKFRSLDPYFNSDLICTLPIELKQGALLNLRGGLYNFLNAKYESNGYTFSYIEAQQVKTYNFYYPQAGTRFMFGVGFSF